jgi:hypothetical protein
MWKIGLRLLLAVTLPLALVFGSAGRWDLPFGWAYLVVLAGAMAAAALVIDRDLLRERAKPGPGGIDRNLRFILVPFFATHLVIAGLDVGRFQWSGHMAAGIQIAGVGGMAASMALSVWAAERARSSCCFQRAVSMDSPPGVHSRARIDALQWARVGFMVVDACARTLVCTGLSPHEHRGSILARAA